MSSSLLNTPISSSIPEVSADLRISDFLKVNPIKLASFDVNICKLAAQSHPSQLYASATSYTRSPSSPNSSASSPAPRPPLEIVLIVILDELLGGSGFLAGNRRGNGEIGVEIVEDPLGSHVDGSQSHRAISAALHWELRYQIQTGDASSLESDLRRRRSVGVNR
nr:hypothetical protein Iba_chr01dCG14690 [Ipomoea batatas]